MCGWASTAAEVGPIWGMGNGQASALRKFANCDTFQLTCSQNAN
jgi:hypothetical protein